MPNYKITHRGPAVNQKREVRISATGTATPSGFTVLNASAAFDQTDKKTLIHLVRDELYKIGVTNLQDLHVVYEGVDSVPATNYHIWETEIHIRIGDEYPIQVFELPTASVDPTVTAVSDNEAIATETVTGKIVAVTGVAIGQTHVDISVLGDTKRVFVYVTENPANGEGGEIVA